MGKILEYHIPGLGKIRAELFEYSSKAYELLNKHGHINRMREIEQLGVIRSVYEGVHHPRWEYVMTQLGIIYKLATRDKATGKKLLRGKWGLSRKINFNSNKISGADIIQIWTLLLNAGHLPGTFATEKAILKSLKSDEKLKKRFKRGLPDRKIKLYLDKIIKTGDIYKFHKILSFFFLQRYKRDDPELVNLLIDVLKFYCFENSHNEAREKLRHVFKRIRQISYLYLDTRYSHIPVNFDLPTIVINLPDYIDELLDYNSPLSKTLEKLDDFLSVTLYQSGESMRIHSYHVREVMKRIRKNKKIRDNVTDLMKFLVNSKNFEPKYMEWEENSTLRLLLEIPYILSDSAKKVLTFDLEDTMNKNYGITKSLINIQPNPKRNMYTISLSFLPGCKDIYRVKILGKFIKDIIIIEEKLIPEDFFELLTGIFDDSYRNLITFTLKQITKSDFQFYYERENYLYTSTIRAKKSEIAAKMLKNILNRQYIINSIPKSRLHEIKATYHTLSSIQHPSYILISLNQIKVLDNKGTHVTDLDGIGLGYKNGKLYLLIIEAKIGKNRVSESKKQLKDTLKKLKLKTSAQPTIESITKYGAYCYIEIDGDR